MEINLEAPKQENIVVFDTKQEQGNKKLKGDPACLLCLNINSYMGGASDVWFESRGFS